MADIIPNGEELLKNNFNVLLLGLHGTGKTTAIQDLAKKTGIKMVYYSCSTLDPYTDLVGIPTPIEGKDGKKELEMVRPRAIDEAELVFFDEFNRADRQTLNAIFEIIQFRSINGELLPSLTACWAAMNPPNDEYQVSEVDPALIDRFDLYLDVSPNVSVEYMSKFIEAKTAMALKTWWDQHGSYSKNNQGKISYISPRRLLKMGQVWDKTKKTNMLKASLPPGATYDFKKLVNMLNPLPVRETSKMGIGSAAPSVSYNRWQIRRSRVKIAQDLRDNPNGLEMHKQIADTLSKGVGSKDLVELYSGVLDSLQPMVLEGMLSAMSSSKVSQMRSHLVQEMGGSRSFSAFPNLKKVLNSVGKSRARIQFTL